VPFEGLRTRERRRAMERSPTTLSQELDKHLYWHRSRLECFFGMIMGIVGAKNAQLPSLAQSFKSKAMPQSRVKRFYRLLREQMMDFQAIAKIIIGLLSLPEMMVLSMDRTNWQFGKKSFNFLVLGVVWQNISIPLLWQNLGKEGNSDTDARSALLARFLRLFPATRVRCLLADREFIGEDWFKWLHKQRISFCIRLKENTLVCHANGGTMPLKQQLKHLQQGQHQCWRKKKLWGCFVQIVLWGLS
jgi:Transposase DDE domain